MNDLRPPEKRLDRIHLALRTHHLAALLEADVVDEDLSKALGGVDDVDRAPAVLLSHDRCLRQAGVRLLPYRREDLQMVVDPPKLIGNLDETELREIPHVGGELSSDTRGGLGPL